MLKVQNVSKKFGSIQALKDICFSLKKGEVVALLGENGAGKSTLLRIISGYLPADSGDITLDDISVASHPLEMRKKYGYVQEISSLYGELSVYEFLLFLADLRQVDKLTLNERVKDVVAKLELQQVLTQRIETLSKGFKKRVELAGALLDEPEMLILDEPTEGLDPNQKYSIRSIIKNYAKGHMVLLSTHTMEDVEAVASRVVLIHKGCLKTDKKINEFKKISEDSLLSSFRKITGR